LWIRNNLAYAYLKGGKVDDARGALESTEPATRTSKRSSVFVCLLATWGLLLIREGNYDAGRVMYQRALELAPRGPLKERVRQKIAIEEAIRRIGQSRPDEARRLLQKAIELNADPEFTAEARRLFGSTHLN
jgi:tetratricopeptide (TPR) repeat protein